MSNDLKYINAIRALGIQSIYNAKQGHPGMTISAAPLTYSIYTKNINITNIDPKWINRDRFVLSGGHGSMSLYPILHFCGVLPLEEMKNFRKQNSLTPGHPESYQTPYIDATTGPLGQGVSIAVGMAIAEKYLSNQYSDLKGLIDHYTYVVLGDGDLQEGISYESMSLAGKLKLNKLICLYDSNNCQLESKVETVNIENTKKRFESMDWYYQLVDNSPESINNAIINAKKQCKPSLIEVQTIIGEGLKEMGNFEAHGCSITDENLNKFNEYYNWDNDIWNFDKEIYDYYQDSVFSRGNESYKNWLLKIEEYKKTNSKRVEQFLKQINNEFMDINNYLKIDELPTNNAGRSIAGYILKKLDENNVRDTIILSPDLSKSTSIKMSGIFNHDFVSPTIYVGIREFGMAGIQNGICLHKGLRCYSSSFMSFVDYFKAAIRLGCISKINPVYFLTHDSVLIGSDGPTHQPIEQIGMLRLIPNHHVLRPCDENEVLASIMFANSQSTSSTSIVLSRQNLASGYNTNIEKTINDGGYKILNNSNSTIAILATGSEVELAMKIAESLNNNVNVDVYSVPNLNLFLKQTKILSDELSKYNLLVVLEASNDSMWYKLLKYNSNIMFKGIYSYGKSMDGAQLYKEYGFDVNEISNEILNFKKEK